MDIATIVGLAGAFFMVISAMGDPGPFIDVPSILIVVVGTAFVVLARSSIPEFIGAIGYGMKTIKFKAETPVELIEKLVELGTIAKKDGMIALEGQDIANKFLAKGVRMMVDGTDAKRRDVERKSAVAAGRRMASDPQKFSFIAVARVARLKHPQAQIDAAARPDDKIVVGRRHQLGLDKCIAAGTFQKPMSVIGIGNVERQSTSQVTPLIGPDHRRHPLRQMARDGTLDKRRHLRRRRTDGDRRQHRDTRRRDAEELIFKISAHGPRHRVPGLLALVQILGLRTPRHGQQR